LDGYPLKLGFVDPADKATGAPVNVYQDGFEISGGDNYGKCIRTTPANNMNKYTDYSDPVVNFKQDLTYGCSVAYSAADLKKLCEDKGTQTNKWIKDFEIFKNLN